LGPTCDDLTRIAVAEFLKLQLVFNEGSWQRICDRLDKRNIPITENNRQQCLFPEDSEILVNSKGTADGCIVEFDGKVLVMLPGPPRECLPLFQKHVIPLLQSRGLVKPRPHCKWLLMGVGEGQVADRVEQFTQSIDVGYRASYPYLEVKFYADQEKLLNDCVEKFKLEFDQHIVSNSSMKASLRLIEILRSKKYKICIEDDVTHGLLQHTITFPEFHDCVDWLYDSSSQYDCAIRLTGMDLFWSGVPYEEDDIKITFILSKQQQEVSVRLLGKKTLEWVVEYVCWVILKAMA